ncbi:MAG: hypothetical protein P9X24_11625 [Candidatus Hatepunaea meridiana]|nr:hypothetical protein [Candidatus Hatepunaea meridiana]
MRELSSRVGQTFLSVLSRIPVGWTLLSVLSKIPVGWTLLSDDDNRQTRMSVLPTRCILCAFVSLWLILILSNVTFAQVGVEMQPNRITIGDPIELSISLSIPEDASVIWPGPEELKPAEIINADTVKTGKTEHTIRYTLSIFEPGQFELTDIPIIITSENNNDTIFVNPGEIEVVSVINPADSTADIRDIHPPMKLAWTLHDLLPFIYIGLALLIIGIAAYYLWRRYKIRKGDIIPWTPPPTPAHVIALKRLEELRIKKFWQDGYLKKYHSELTDIVKEYIGGRYDINAPEMTTYELLEIERRWAKDREWLKKVKRILEDADLVKFAKYKTDPHQNEKSLDTAFKYVEATKPYVESITVAKEQEVEA